MCLLYSWSLEVGGVWLRTSVVMHKPLSFQDLYPLTHPVQLPPTTGINSFPSVTPFPGTQIALPELAHNLVSTGYNQTIVVQNAVSNSTQGVPGNTSHHSFPVTVIPDVTANPSFENPGQSIQTSVPVVHLAGTGESDTTIQNVVACPDLQLSLQSSQPSTSVEHSTQPRVIRPRRPIKKPLRLQDTILLEEPSLHIVEEGAARTYVADSNARFPSPGHVFNSHSGDDHNSVAIPEAVPSTSSGRRRGGRQHMKEMTDEQKYRRTRQLNNEASKRCREKRKTKLSGLEREELSLLEKNEKLKEDLALLTARRDKLKKMVDMVFAKSVQAKYGNR